jgi:hypothetical protein
MAHFKKAARRRITFVKLAFALVAGGMLGACASSTVKPTTAPDGANDALVGETRNQCSLDHQEWFLLGGVDRRWMFGPKPAFEREDVKYHRVAAGRHKIYVRLIATADRVSSGSRNDVVTFESVEFDAGKAYRINGSCAGGVFDVWIEDEHTKERIASAVQIKPRQLSLGR